MHLLHSCRYVAWLATLVIGCAESHPSADDGSVLRDADTCHGVQPVDLLFVVQGTGYMELLVREAQDSLGELLTPLTAAGEFDLHVGVVISNLGAGEPWAECGLAGFDGVLMDQGAPHGESCEPTGRTFVVLNEEAEVRAAQADIACRLFHGNDLCWAQDLETLLKAVTPTDSTITFRGVAGGNADRENVGFLRPDAILAVILLGRMNDCSAADPSYLIHGPRCGRVCCEDELFPVERYIEGLAALEREIVVNAIAGVPRGSFPAAGDGSAVRALLDSPEMQRESDALCSTALVDYALPAPRLIRLAAAYPGVVRSVCAADDLGDGLGPAFREIGEHLAERARCSP